MGLTAACQLAASVSGVSKSGPTSCGSRVRCLSTGGRPYTPCSKQDMGFLGPRPWLFGAQHALEGPCSHLGHRGTVYLFSVRRLDLAFAFKVVPLAPVTQLVVWSFCS